MKPLTINTAERIASLLSATIKGITFYPPGHPAVAQPVKEIYEILARTLETKEEIHLGVLDGTFFIEDHIFVTPKPAVEELAVLLSSKEIKGITLSSGLSQEDLTRFIMLVAPKSATSEIIEQALIDEGIESIKLRILGGAGAGSGDIGDDEDEPTGTDEKAALQTYRKTLTVIKDIFKEIEVGRIPSSKKVIKVIRNFVSITMNDPTTLLGLAMIKDYDNYTFNHSVNVGVLSMALASALCMDKKDVEEVGVAALLHDVGKTGIDLAILNKPGKLTAVELAAIKKHPEIGAVIIRKMDGLGERIAQAVLGHHIMHNRQGYPEWARSEQFDILADIIAIADSYDACTTLRCYQRPMSPRTALDKMRELAGTYVDDKVLQKFMDLMGKYPVGTLVRLDNNEVAVVFRPNPNDPQNPIIKIIVDASGQLLEEGKTVQLGGDGRSPYAAIVAEVDPIMKNIDVTRYLT